MNVFHRLGRILRFLSGPHAFATISVISSIAVLWLVPQIHNILFHLPVEVGEGEAHYRWFWEIYAVGLVAVYTILTRVVVRPDLEFNVPSALWKVLGIVGLVWMLLKCLGITSQLQDLGKQVSPVPLELILVAASMLLAPAIVPRLANLTPKRSGGFLRRVVILIGRLLLGRGPTRSPWNSLVRLVLLWLFFFFIGEVIWRMASWHPYFVSHRAYMVWAVYHGVFTVIAVARVVDFAAVSEWGRKQPVRPAVVLGFLVVAMVFWQPVQVGESKPNQSSQADLARQWFDTVDQRLTAIEREHGGPAVIVAASGGGSRAAIFTALVLDSLERIDPELASPGERAFLYSGVSGGSLACAYYLHREYISAEPMRQVVAWERAIPGEVAHRMIRRADELRPYLEKNAGTSQLAQSKLEVIQGLDPNAPETVLPDWIKTSAFFDEMGASFLAPLLRGSFIPGRERGQMVSRYWERTFGWSGITNQSFLDKGRDETALPVALFNSSDIDSGQRLTVGFPPLPPELLNGTSAMSLVDQDPGYEVSLAQAVRLSANFPWVFATPKVNANSGTSYSLSDGGVVDNTGMDTVLAMFQGLESAAKLDPGALTDVDEVVYARLLKRRSQRLLNRLRKMGLVFVIIDSGARPSSKGTMGRVFPELFEPLRAISNADAADAVAKATASIEQIETILRRSSRSRGDVVKVNSLVWTCNGDDEDVVTTWSLGSDGKARLLLSFLGEFHRMQGEEGWRYVLAIQEELQMLADAGETEERRLALERLADLSKRFESRNRLRGQESLWLNQQKAGPVSYQRSVVPVRESEPHRMLDQRIKSMKVRQKGDQ